MLKFQQPFEFNQLSLKTHIWKYYWSFRTGKLKRLLKCHMIFLH